MSKEGFGTDNRKPTNKSDNKGPHEMPYGSIVALDLLCRTKAIVSLPIHCPKKLTGSVRACRGRKAGAETGGAAAEAGEGEGEVEEKGKGKEKEEE